LGDQALELRLDVWLFRARLMKTRKGSAELISKGKVRLTRNQETRRVTKPGLKVHIGDMIAFMRGPTLFQVEITAQPLRRGPAKEARECYKILGIQSCDSNES